FGRAPTTADVDIAMILLGLDPALPSDRAGGYAEFRAAALANLSHRPDRSRALVAGVPLDLLAASPSEVRARVHGGEWSPSV
ncbi:MAG: hypothetical protein R3246_09735, partial [Acidimicrobiia bacterium]|nr:hypothetical protein [Acidimicrobiia bacterium]